MDSLDNNEYEIINIEAMCHESFPCYHNVKIKINNNDEIIDKIIRGDTIANYYKNNNIVVPQHFVIYLNNRN